MTVKIGISGMGRIGRMALRIALQDPGVEVVAINATSDITTLAHLLRYDSTHGRWDVVIQARDDELIIDGHSITVLKERNPLLLPWGALGAEVVLEATGQFTSYKAAAQHLEGGAKKVVLSTAAKDDMLTIVYGVNHSMYDSAVHDVISGASCTTNSLSPIVHVLHKNFVIKKGAMTTVHSYTNDQRVLDNPHSDLRRARSASQSIIPTGTGAAKAVTKVIPELKGLLNGHSLRVPTPDVSIVDFVAELDVSATVQDVNQALVEASHTYLSGILEVSFEPLVSSDYIGNSHSSIVDALSTMMIGNNMAKVMAWYDNEWAYAHRMVDLMRYVGEKTDQSVELASDLLADAKA